jgi:hypothetical protein
MVSTSATAAQRRYGGLGRADSWWAFPVSFIATGVTWTDWLMSILCGHCGYSGGAATFGISAPMLLAFAPMLLAFALMESHPF